jgi:hypothetical protein
MQLAYARVEDPGTGGSDLRPFSVDTIKGNSPRTCINQKRSRSVSGVSQKQKRRRPTTVSKKSLSSRSEISWDGEDSETEDEFDGATHECIAVDVGDEKKLTTFYETQFRLMGQVCLKVVVKAWIKNIQPKKSGSNPYNGGKRKEESVAMFGEHMDGELTKPWWWPPNTFGWKEFSGCRHTEPDHVLKPGQSISSIQHSF